MKRLAAIFWELFKISALVIGGGYAIIVVADQLFARKRWIREGELLEQLPVFQSIPGLVATHTAVYLGNKLAGGWGALVGVLAVALPSIAVFTLVAAGYDRLPLGNPFFQSALTGLRAALTGIIAAAVLRSAKPTLNGPFAWGLMFVALLAMTVGKLPVPVVMVAAMLVGLARVAVPGAFPKARCRVVVWPLLLFVKYGLLGFGGGFVLVPMYLEDFVGAGAPYLQVGEDLFANIMALSQMTPGPVGVNCATFFGYRLAGVGGALAASALLLLPGSLLAWVVIRSLARFHENRWVRGLLGGIRPTSISLMLIALWVFADSAFIDWWPVLLALGAAVVAYGRRFNVVAVIVASGVLGCLMQMGVKTWTRYSG